jgi:hypothetical protein
LYLALLRTAVTTFVVGGQIPNEAYDERDVAGVDQLINIYTFTVYTKQDIDLKLKAMQAAIDNMQQSADRNAQILNDTKREILNSLDNLSANLPSDAKFYHQIRERLKSDIAAEIDPEIDRLDR